MREDNAQQQFEQQQEQEWIDEHEGQFECMYCGNVFVEKPVTGCCGEMHFDIIGE